MNKQRRKRVCEAFDMLHQATEILAEVGDEESEAFDNLPEGIQESERGQKMEDIIDAIDDAMEELDELVESIKEVCEI